MTINSTLPLFIFALLVCRFPCQQSLGDEKDADKPRIFALEEMLKEPGHVNGLLLKTTKAEVVIKNEKRVLRVNWSLAYTGKRWPLVILEPSLERATSGQTMLVVVAKGVSGETYGVVIESPSPRFPIKSELAWFLEISKEKREASGMVETDLGPAKEKFIKYYPKEFSERVTPEIYIQLRLDIQDRGLDEGLDAWTGSYSAGAIRVSLEKW
ncbi:MAG: hypothetical protein EXS09_20335 [Gemmataceae bacterium]|nr:hypothetical protein [Gemmataceae bacterium]